MAGKVTVQCFDKTGTLTTDTLDFAGLLPVETSNSTAATGAGEYHVDSMPTYTSTACFGARIEVDKRKFCFDARNLLHVGLATCHTVIKLDQHAQRDDDEND